MRGSWCRIVTATRSTRNIQRCDLAKNRNCFATRNILRRFFLVNVNSGDLFESVVDLTSTIAMTFSSGLMRRRSNSSIPILTFLSTTRHPRRFMYCNASNSPCFPTECRVQVDFLKLPVMSPNSNVRNPFSHCLNFMDTAISPE